MLAIVWQVSVHKMEVKANPPVTAATAAQEAKLLATDHTVKQAAQSGVSGAEQLPQRSQLVPPLITMLHAAIRQPPLCTSSNIKWCVQSRER